MPEPPVVRARARIMHAREAALLALVWLLRALAGLLLRVSAWGMDSRRFRSLAWRVDPVRTTRMKYAARQARALGHRRHRGGRRRPRRRTQTQVGSKR